jgi:hypothetical protein
MTILLLGTPARLHHDGILKTLLKASLAALLMGALAALLVRWLPTALPGSFVGELAILLIIGIVCGAVYLQILSVLRVAEVQIVLSPMRQLVARVKTRG